MDDERWEPGHAGPRPASGPTSPARARVLPPSLQGLPPRSVPEVAPTPLQQHYVCSSVTVLICGAIAITALELGAPLGSPLVKLCVAHRRPAPGHHDGRRDRAHLALGLGVDAGRSDQGLFRLAWVVVSLIGLTALVAAPLVVLAA